MSQFCYSFFHRSENSYIVNKTTGDRVSQHKFKLGDQLEVKCEEGYDGEPATATCQVGGSWSSNLNITCRKLSCTRPDHPQHGYVIDDGKTPSGAMFLEGDVVQFGCRHGYNMEGEGRARCTSDGLWLQSEKTVCKRKTLL
jgi:hypothetical protein